MFWKCELLLPLRYTKTFLGISWRCFIKKKNFKCLKGIVIRLLWISTLQHVFFSFSRYDSEETVHFFPHTLPYKVSPLSAVYERALVPASLSAATPATITWPGLKFREAVIGTAHVCTSVQHVPCTYDVIKLYSSKVKVKTWNLTRGPYGWPSHNTFLNITHSRCS